MPDQPERPTISAVTFRLPRSAYLLVVVVAIAVTAAVQHAWLAFVYVLPVLVAVYIARVSTRVDSRGITVRLIAGHRLMTWPQLQGLTVVERNVYAVVENGLVRLPCVRIADLHVVSAASGGRLPEIARPTPKFAPGRRSRR